jgi:hypothetical protein
MRLVLSNFPKLMKGDMRFLIVSIEIFIGKVQKIKEL